MFYSVEQASVMCADDPSLSFQVLKTNDKEVIEKVIDTIDFDFNIVDEFGNNIVMCLLKNKYYDLVLKYIDKIDINHQNNDGDTIMHMLSTINYLNVREIIDYIFSKSEINLNLKNNQGETILDKSINNGYLYTTIKILENEKFELIDVYSFKKLYDTYIKSDNYGKYSKLNNLEIIINSIENKKLIPKMRKLVYLIENNKDSIEDEFNKSKTSKIDKLINRVIKEVIN